MTARCFEELRERTGSGDAKLSDMLRRLTEDGIVEYFTSNDRTVRRHARNRRVYDFGYTLPARRSSFLGQRVSAALKRTKSHRLHALPAAPYFAVNLDTAKTQSPAGQLCLDRGFALFTLLIHCLCRIYPSDSLQSS